jgi:hypothetical protein
MISTTHGGIQPPLRLIPQGEGSRVARISIYGSPCEKADQ